MGSEFLKAHNVFKDNRKVVIHYETVNVKDCDKILLAETHVARNNTTLVCIGEKFRCLIRWNNLDNKTKKQNFLPKLVTGEKVPVEVSELKFGKESSVMSLDKRDKVKRRKEENLKNFDDYLEQSLTNNVNENVFDNMFKTNESLDDREISELKSLDGLSGIARKGESGAYFLKKVKDHQDKPIDRKIDESERQKILESIKKSKFEKSF